MTRQSIPSANPLGDDGVACADFVDKASPTMEPLPTYDTSSSHRPPPQYDPRIQSIYDTYEENQSPPSSCYDPTKPGPPATVGGESPPWVRPKRYSPAGPSPFVVQETGIKSNVWIRISPPLRDPQRSELEEMLSSSSAGSGAGSGTGLSKSMRVRASTSLVGSNAPSSNDSLELKFPSSSHLAAIEDEEDEVFRMHSGGHCRSRRRLPAVVLTMVAAVVLSFVSMALMLMAIITVFQREREIKNR